MTIATLYAGAVIAIMAAIFAAIEPEVQTALIIALPTALMAFASPLVLSVLTSSQRRADKEQDWARQDALIAGERKTHSQLAVVHSLVNSSMTASKQSELDASRRELALLEENMARDARENLAINQDMMIRIGTAKVKIEALEKEIAERLRQAKVIEEQEKAEAAAASAALVSKTA